MVFQLDPPLEMRTRGGQDFVAVTVRVDLFNENGSKYQVHRVTTRSVENDIGGHDWAEFYGPVSPSGRHRPKAAAQPWPDGLANYVNSALHQANGLDR